MLAVQGFAESNAQVGSSRSGVKPTTFSIKLYIDTVCPWCYIGLKNLQRAIQLYQRTYPAGSADTFAFEYPPFYLDASAPVPGIAMRDRIIHKNGEEMARGIVTRLERVGRASGINFSFDGKIGRTRDSHRLLHFAGLQDQRLQQALVDNIFHELFEKDLDITARPELAAIAVASGLDADDVTQILESDIYSAEVDQQAAQARESGVRHVPFMELNGKTLEGSQGISELYELLVDAKTCS